MKLLYGFIAQAASISKHEHVSAVNIFHQVNFDKFPSAYPRPAIVLAFGLEANEVGRDFEYSVILRDPRGQHVTGKNAAGDEIVGVSGNFIAHERGFQGTTVVPILIETPGVIFPIAGQYYFEIFVGQKPIGRIPVFASQNQIEKPKDEYSI